MVQSKGKKRFISLIMVFALFLFLAPIKASGEVKTITDLEDKLDNISEEEKAVLEELFTLEQEIDTLEQKETLLKDEIKDLQEQINDLKQEIEKKQADYDKQLDILKKVLVNYQRGGPASSLEILLDADDLSSFLKSLNIMKDISHNVNELLASLKDGKEILLKKKDSFDANKTILSQKEEELQADLHTKQDLQKKQEDYLAALLEDKAFYKEQLDNVSQMWESCKSLFPGISGEITQIIGAGYFTLEDLNLQYGFFSISGSLSEAVFNRILSDNSKQPDTSFYFEDGQVRIEVPKLHLVLRGNFVISEDTAIQFEAFKGTFFDMPLEQGSLEELFKNGPLRIDFKSIANDVIAIDFKIKEVGSTEASLKFTILPQF